MNAIATTRSLGFAYGGASRCVLHDVDLAIAPGELALVAGPSGAGKSTLLRCFNGLVPHFHGGRFSGQVVVGGMDTRAHQPRDLARVAGMVFQEPEAQAVARTVQEEIVFGLENRGTSSTAIRKRLEEVLDALGIADLRTRELKTLSGGELQRVAIAAVLTMQPALILLDEPTSQLDPQAADDVLRLVRDLREDLGLGVVITEHRLERIAAHADRVLHVPGDGSVRAMGTREAMAMLPGAPPVSRIGRTLGWSPLPLSVAEGRAFLNGDARPEAAAGPASARGAVIASLRGMRVELSGREVLHISDLALHEGERVAVMGRNGAGKTTLLRTIAELQATAAGVVDGPVSTAASTRFRDIAYVPQDPAASLYKPTIEGEIEDVLQGTGRAGTVAEALAEWDLRNFAARDARDLSVGERQRAALAAMLVGRPRLILLDEPTRGMDAGAKQLLVSNLDRRAHEGACVVLASHDVELAASFADRVILLSEGEVVADEPVREALTGNVAFSTQASKLFGPGVLTAEDAIARAKSGER